MIFLFQICLWSKFISLGEEEYTLLCNHILQNSIFSP